MYAVSLRWGTELASLPEQSTQFRVTPRRTGFQFGYIPAAWPWAMSPLTSLPQLCIWFKDVNYIILNCVHQISA